MRHCVGLLFILVFVPLGAYSQYFLSGTDGASIKWKQLQGSKFRIVFPAADSLRAGAYYCSLNRAVPLITRSLGGDFGSLDVVLHSFSARSNALTVWAPSRLEVFPVPPDDSYSQPWPDQLALHELRHVAQLSVINTGLTGTLSSLFGQHVTGMVFGLHLPEWFIEGDAVYSETVFSESGRGRDPLFRMVSKAWAAYEIKKSYNLLLFGSYRQFSPSAYEFGYDMVSHVRRKAGVGVFDTVVRYVARRPWHPFAMSTALKSATSLSTDALFDRVVTDLKANCIVPEGAFPKTSLYVDFVRPRHVQGGAIVAVRERFGERADVVSFADSEASPEVLFSPGSIDAQSFDAGGTWLAWTESEAHPRWEHQQYSVVWMGHLETKKVFCLRRQTRWYAPSISPDASRLAVVELDVTGRESLLILSIPDGAELVRIKLASGDHLMSPAWDGEGAIVALRLNEAGKMLVRYQLSSATEEVVFNFRYRFVLSPAVISGTPIVTTERDGKAVLAAVYADSMRVVGAGGFGVHFASGLISGRWLCSVYTPAGYRILPMAGFSYETLTDSINPWLDENSFAEAEQHLADGAVIDSSAVPQSEPYQRGAHLFRFHSLMPAAYDVASREVDPGVTLLSQNTLGTAVGSLGYRYLNTLGNHQLFATFDYYDFYPVIGLEATAARRQTSFLSDEGALELNWTEASAAIRSYVPLSWSRGKHNYGFIPQISFKGEWYEMDNGSPLDFTHDAYLSVNYSLQAYHTEKSSVRDIYPRWGQVFYGLFRSGPFGGANLGEMAAGEGVFYFPGIGAHHATRVYLGYEYQTEGANYFGYAVDFPRGAKSFRLPHRAAGSLTYAFPLVCPDWDLGKMAYIKRLTSKMFYDVNLGYTAHFNHFVHTVGVEVNADWHLLRLITPLNSGIRLSWLPDERSVTVEWLLSINFDVL